LTLICVSWVLRVTCALRAMAIPDQ
jgi:hypothetical protein